MLRRLPCAAVVAIVALAPAGCGGGRVAVPSQRPEAAMKKLLELEFAGMHVRAWGLLVREQREAISRGLFLACQGPGLAHVEIEVLDARDEVFDVPGLGKAKTKVLRWKATVSPPGSKAFTLQRTGHLIAQDGVWRWTLSPATFRAYSRGSCTYTPTTT
jgi:hypothetical protein